MSLEVGKQATYKAEGFDQFGNDFDISALPATWTLSDPGLASDAPSGDTDVLTGVAPGDELLTVEVGGFSDALNITITEPVPVLSGVKIVEV
jgi:hypothetical protein